VLYGKDFCPAKKAKWFITMKCDGKLICTEQNLPLDDLLRYALLPAACLVYVNME